MARTLVVGDVHGCARELGRMLRRTNPTRVILVGDLFTKGPDPAGVWKLIRQWRAEAVLGNWDAHVLEHWRPGKRLPRRAFRWLERRPHLITGKGWVTAHAGIHPRGVHKTRRRHAVGMSSWTLKEGAKWWSSYRGDDLVLFGHHARLGVRRNRHTLCLDSNCVKGGGLSGYLLEREQIVRVPSRNWV